MAVPRYSWRARTDLGWLAALLAAAVYFVLMSTFYPFRDVFEFDPDEGNRLLIARTLQQGHHLYSEIWDDQPPLFSHVTMWWCRLVGWEVNNVRILILLFGAAAIFAAYDSARLLWGHAAALAATALLPCTMYFMRLSVSAMVGLPAIALALLCVWALLRWAMSGRLGWLLAAGALMGLSLMTKLFTGFLLPVFGLWVLMAAWQQRHRNAPAWKVLVPPALWSLAVIAVAGTIALLSVGPASFCHLYDAHVQVPRPEHPLKSGLHGVLWMIHFDWEAAFLAFLGTVQMVVTRRWRLALVAGWCLVGLIALILHSPRWYHHHLLLSIPGCVIAGVAVAEIFARGWKPQRGWAYPARVVLRLTAAALIFCLVVALIQGKKREPARPSEKRRDHDWFALKVMNAFADKTQMVVTDRPMYAFRGGFTVPPNFCQTSRKRSLTGNLTVGEFIETVREHRPEQIVLVRLLYPEARAILEAANDKYVLVYHRRATTRIYIREDIANDWFSTIQDLAEQTGHVPAHDFLALQWIERGDVAQGLGCLERAVALDPSEPLACVHLAEAYMAGGRFAEAFEVLQTGRRKAEGRRYLELTRMYAWRRATCSDESYRDAAAAEASIDAVIATYNRPWVGDLEIKAAAVAAQGRFTEAVVTVTEAIERAKEREERGRIERLERQLQSYRDGKPIIERVEMPRS